MGNIRCVIGILHQAEQLEFIDILLDLNTQGVIRDRMARNLAVQHTFGVIWRFAILEPELRKLVAMRRKFVLRIVQGGC